MDDREHTLYASCKKHGNTEVIWYKGSEAAIKATPQEFDADLNMSSQGLWIL